MKLLTGTAWPVEGMHRWLKAVYYIIPLALPSEALRAISCRAWDIYHPTVYYGFLSAAIYLVIFVIATTVVAKLQKMGYKVSLSLMWEIRLYVDNRGITLDCVDFENDTWSWTVWISLTYSIVLTIFVIFIYILNFNGKHNICLPLSRSI